MFASFGSISFQPLASPTKLEIEKKYHYEAINVIGSAPVLQWIYDNLRHVELSIYLHNFWCKPQTAINALTQLADFHVPQQFVFGNKNNLGTFVISNYRLKQRWMADDGSVIAAEMDLELTEYVAPSTLQSNTMTVGTIGNSTLSSANLKGSRLAYVLAGQEINAFINREFNGGTGYTTDAPGLTTTQSSSAGSTLVVSPATASPSGIAAQTPFTNVALSAIARAA